METKLILLVLMALIAIVCAMLLKVGEWESEKVSEKPRRSKGVKRAWHRVPVMPPMNFAWLLRFVPWGRAPKVTFANAVLGEGTHLRGLITRKAAAAIATRFLLVKKGADDDHMIVCTADTDIPIGVCQNEAAAAEDLITVQTFGGAGGTMKAQFGGTVACGDLLQVDSNSKLKKLSTSTGTYYIVGQALYAAASGDIAEFVPCVPVQRVVP